MKRSSRNGGVGVQGSRAHTSFVPTATVDEYAWGGDTEATLRIRREAKAHKSGNHRVEIDLLDLLKAVCERSEEESGAVREYFAVMRLDRARPEVIFRQVTTPLGLGGDGYEQAGLASSFGDPAAVVGLLHAAAERSGASALALMQSLRTVPTGDDELVVHAVCQLEEIAA